VKGGKGYYFKAKENFTLAPNVENKVESPITDPEEDILGTDIRADQWNLIGSIQEYNQRPSNSSAFATLQGTVEPVLSQKYNNGSRILETSPPLKNDTGYINGKLSSGEAYWAYSEENGTYRVPASDIPS